MSGSRYNIYIESGLFDLSRDNSYIKTVQDFDQSALSIDFRNINLNESSKFESSSDAENHYTKERTPSVIIKTGKQDYFGLLGLQDSAAESSSSEDEELAQPANGSSTKVSNLSLVYPEFPKQSTAKGAEDSRSVYSFTTFCKECGKKTPSRLAPRVQVVGFLKSLKLLFQAMKCCSEGGLSGHSETVVSCVKCGSVVAMIKQ